MENILIINDETMGKALKAWRIERNLKQETLAEKMQILGFNWINQTVYKVEKGIREISANEMQALVFVLCIEPTDFMKPVWSERNV
jgi:transcriptional regulator with XRE-family HTH domain